MLVVLVSNEYMQRAKVLQPFLQLSSMFWESQPTIQIIQSLSQFELLSRYKGP